MSAQERARGTAGAADGIAFERSGAVGLVTLDRPKALNALTLEMCQAFELRLAAWADDPTIAAVIVAGAGERAFCAGGDVRAIWQAGKRGERLTADFFRAEYTLNRRIKVFPKPYIALIDGIAMGGGVGVSVHGSHRVATERALVAMPETRIGLFPDVGSSYVLPRLPGRLGLYLGLTGTRLGAADSIHAGIATHHVPSERLDALVAALVEADWSAGKARAVVDETLERFAADPGEATLSAQRAAIDRCFAAGSVEAIVEAVAREQGPWAEATREALAAASPTSLKITFEALRRGAEVGFDAAMIMEYRLSQACMARHDFYEGIRAAVIDKDNAPVWDPPDLAHVTPALVEAHFAPLGPDDLRFQ